MFCSRNGALSADKRYVVKPSKVSDKEGGNGGVEPRLDGDKGGSGGLSSCESASSAFSTSGVDSRIGDAGMEDPVDKRYAEDSLSLTEETVESKERRLVVRLLLIAGCDVLASSGVAYMEKTCSNSSFVRRSF